MEYDIRTHEDGQAVLERCGCHRAPESHAGIDVRIALCHSLIASVSSASRAYQLALEYFPFLDRCLDADPDAVLYDT